MSWHQGLERLFAEQFRIEYLVAVAIVLVGLVVGYAIGKLNKRLLTGLGVPGAVEGTAFERTANRLGTSTVALISRLSSWFLYGVAVVFAVQVADLPMPDELTTRLTAFLPHLFVAVLVLIAGLVVGDKLELLARDRLQGVRAPDVAVIPAVVRYTVIYLAALIALSQVGVATAALLVLLAVYLFALVFGAGIAFWDLLTSSAAGMYLLLHEPYGIGDEIRIGQREGIVQEVDLFVTRIESGEEEYIVPNRHVLKYGVALIVD